MCQDSPRLASIAKENISIGKKMHEQTEVQIAQAVAAHVLDEEFQKLCFLLNVKPAPLTETCKGKSLFDCSYCQKYVAKKPSEVATKLTMDPAEFLKKPVAGKWYKYVHSYWHGVSINIERRSLLVLSY